MNRRPLTLLFAALFVACSAFSVIAPSASPVLAAGPLAPSAGLIIDTPLNGSHLSSSNISITWHLVGSLSSIQYYSVKVDEGAWLNNLTGTSFSLISPEEGAHRVMVEAWTELEGLYYAEVTFFVDTVPPEVVGFSPTGNGALASSAIIISFSEQMDPYSVTIDGVEGTSGWNGNVLTISPNVPWQMDHQYTIVVNGNDLAGNNLSTFSWSFATADLGTISGQVKDERNETVQGADIVLLQGGEIVASTTTDSEGRFSLTAPSGSYNLTISKSDIITRTIQVEVIGGQGVDLGEVSVQLVPSSTWILIDVVIVIGAVGLFLVGRRNQKLAKK